MGKCESRNACSSGTTPPEVWHHKHHSALLRATEAIQHKKYTSLKTSIACSKNRFNLLVLRSTNKKQPINSRPRCQHTLSTSFTRNGIVCKALCTSIENKSHRHRHRHQHHRRCQMSYTSHLSKVTQKSYRASSCKHPDASFPAASCPGDGI